MVDGMLTRGEIARVPASISPDDVERDLPKVEDIISAAAKVLDQMSPYS